MSNGYKILSFLDFVQLPNHTQFLLLNYKQINKRFKYFTLIIRNSDATYVVSTANCV